MPNERSIDEGALEEERRLLYVAITRAKDILIMSRVRERMRFGQNQHQKISRFIAELPEDYVNIMDVRDVFKKVTLEEMRKAFANFVVD